MKKKRWFIYTGGGFVFLILISVWYFLFSNQPSPLPVLSYPTPTTVSPTDVPKRYPADMLDLTNWKLTVPIGPAEHPTEIRQPQLATYILDPWFVINDTNDGIRFRAPVSAVTTSGSNYPRSELREMTNGGATNASWGSTSGTHVMQVDETITAVPKTKQHVVAGQIHDAHDDIIVIRLEMPYLYVNVNGKNLYVLDKNYSLGKRFSYKFFVHDGKIDVYYNGSAQPVYTLTKNFTGAYFKAGVYTQSNCSKEKASDCTEQNYGEVVIYHLAISHA